MLEAQLTALMSDLPPVGGWTVDDLGALPEDGVRRELLDGVLLVSPSPTDFHQIVAARLMVALEASCPPELHVTQGVEVRISPRRAFTPDVLVTTDAAAQRRPRHYLPHEVMLAVEIVSSLSLIMDRITKPALYAAAGIPFYWRIETGDGLTVHTHKIDPEHEVYRSSGTFQEQIVTAEPWEIDLPISRITPRYL
ncbi:Uma2 family endonuclease [Actinoplanes sp. KI2]|uniref:Uma2 family endonuclease n=1 Tax=Actinoplanes sp. KI2 TaxID=2983315 RepID=UPI0021D5C0A3|nr:Uma2 family endonuclease [Actinoplanes sp. KI2]MCU7723186.1 Uma2 family endonuclease [Actinoplanes sp. KI2]